MKTVDRAVLTIFTVVIVGSLTWASITVVQALEAMQPPTTTHKHEIVAYWALGRVWYDVYCHDTGMIYEDGQHRAVPKVLQPIIKEYLNE